MIGLRENVVACGASTRKAGSKDVVLTSFKIQAEVCAEPESEVKGLYGHDSDTDRDSGIVGCGQRVGSTSSTDTDSSQEFRQKVHFRTPLVSIDSSHDPLNNLQFRTVKRNNCLTPHGVPVKGDHALLKNCNRRPPTPLTVLTEPNQCVRFDDQLPLSEQNIRRSCRKLFATLYAQRFPYAAPNIGDTVPQNRPPIRSEPPQLRLQYHDHGTARSRSSMDSQKNLPVSRKAVSWNLSLPARRASLEQVPLPEATLQKQGVDSTPFALKELPITGTIPNQLKDCRPSLKTSTDSGISVCRSRCTCQDGNRDSSGSSQSSNSSNCSSSTNHSCCCHESNPTPEVLKNPTLFKSNSCSTLPNILLQSTLPRKSQQLTAVVPPTVSPPVVTTQQRCPVALQKTSSCTNLINRTRNGLLTTVPVYNDNMMHVYAQVASVVPDHSPQTTGKIAPMTHHQKRNENPYDVVKSPPVSVTSNVFGNRTNAVTFRSYKPPRRSAINVYPNAPKNALAVQNVPQKCLVPCETKDRILIPSTNYESPMMGRLVPYRQGNRRENTYVTVGRPMTSVIPGMEKQHVYLKSALKPPRSNSQLSVHQPPQIQMLPNPSERKVTCEAEYAVVDKSKKNKCSSLPVLNLEIKAASSSDDDKQPPVPPKKNLHKSDRSRSSSPKKSLMNKMSNLTRSAKSAFQRAFSTERIYRPEKEERLEAAGQALQRSKSIIKGLRASLSKKRRKHKPPMAEVVPQACNNPIWDENSLGPNPPTHVRGQLLQLNLDGSQVVELSKPPNKPYGFFVARGRVRNSRGVFVSRMRDQETQKQLAGILDIGDEILEIEGRNVKNSDIMEVNNLMANKNTLLLTVLPYICRKDI